LRVLKRTTDETHIITVVSEAGPIFPSSADVKMDERLLAFIRVPIVNPAPCAACGHCKQRAKSNEEREAEKIINNSSLHALDWQDKNGRTALHEAVIVGNDPIVKSLLDNRVNLLLEDNDGRNAIDHVCLNFIIPGNYYSIASAIFEKEPYHRARNKLNWWCSPLLWACYAERLTTIAILINERRADVNEEFLHGTTILYYLVVRDQYDMVHLLLETYHARAVVALILSHVVTSTHNKTIMDVAIEDVTNVLIVKDLLKHGFPVEHKLPHNCTPFFSACAINNVEIAQALIDYGANIHVVGEGNDSTTALSKLSIENRTLVEEYYQRACNWRRRKSYAFFLSSLKKWPMTDVAMRGKQRVFAIVLGLERFVGSFL